MSVAAHGLPPVVRSSYYRILPLAEVIGQATGYVWRKTENLGESFCFKNKEAESQRRWMTCLKSHCNSKSELMFVLLVIILIHGFLFMLGFYWHYPKCHVLLHNEKTIQRKTGQKDFHRRHWYFWHFWEAGACTDGLPLSPNQTSRGEKCHWGSQVHRRDHEVRPGVQ